MSKLITPEDNRESTWSRRAWLGSTAAAVAGAWLPAIAQTTSAAAEEARAPAMPALGSALDVPRLTLLDGSVFEPAQAQGRPLLVYWWASTCPFCALQSPSMEAFWRAHKARGLVMLALSIDRTPAAAAGYLQKKGYTFPAAWTSHEWRRSFPKPQGLPVTLLRARDGKLVLAEKGQMFAEDIEDMARLL